MGHLLEEQEARNERARSLALRGPESAEARRLRELREELGRVNATLSPQSPADVIYLAVETVADMLARRAAIEYMLAAVECRDRDAAERVEAERRRLEAFREQMKTDDRLRVEVERRNASDVSERRWHRSPKSHGLLPGGFPDSYRARRGAV
jgi:hypothetical protein